MEYVIIYEEAEKFKLFGHLQNKVLSSPQWDSDPLRLRAVLVFMWTRIKKPNSKCDLQLINDHFQQSLSSEAVLRSRGGQLIAHPCLRVMSWGVPPAAMQCDSRVGWAGPTQPS